MQAVKFGDLRPGDIVVDRSAGRLVVSVKFNSQTVEVTWLNVWGTAYGRGGLYSLAYTSENSVFDQSMIGCNILKATDR